MRHKFGAITISALLALTAGLTSGCWDQQELNEVAIVTGLGIDRGEQHKFRLSVETLNPTQFSEKSHAGSAQASTLIYSMEGDSIAELSRRLNTGLSRKVSYSHMRVLILGEDLAKEGVEDFVDFMERFREIRNDFNILVAKESTAKDALQIRNPLQKISSIHLNAQIDTMVKDWGGDPFVRMNDFINALTSPGREPVSALVSIRGDVQQGKKSENSQKTNPTLLVLGGMALFQEGRMVGEMPLTETRNYLWTQDQIRETSQLIPCLNDDKMMDVRIYHTKTSVKGKMHGSKPSFVIRILAESRIDETQCPFPFDDARQYEQLEKQINSTVVKEIAGTVKKVQEKYGIDIFGFGEVLNRQQHPEFLKVKDRWNTYFTKADVQVEADIQLRRTGIRTKSFLNQERRS